LSHLGATEDPNEKELYHRQLEKFNALQSVFGDTPIYHVLNTSGVFNYPQSHGGMVRSALACMGMAIMKK
jgi:alanine racemase